MDWYLSNHMIMPFTALRRKTAMWFRVITQPAASRAVLAGALEFLGVGLVLYGLYLLHTLAFILGLGGFCLLISQGLSGGNEKT